MSSSMLRSRERRQTWDVRNGPLAGKRLRRSGALSTDQIFTLEQTGTFNVTKIHEWFLRNPDRFPKSLVPLNQAVADYVRRNYAGGLNEEYLASLTTKDLENRFAFALGWQNERGETEINLIDGSHYIVKMWELRQPHYALVIVPEEMHRYFRVIWEVQDAAGWRVLKPAEFLSQIARIQSFADGRAVLDGVDVTEHYKQWKRTHRRRRDGGSTDWNPPSAA